MKILLTINDISTWGGGERVVVNLANALSEKGYEVEILSFYRANEGLPYHINDTIKLHFWHNISESLLKSSMCRVWLSKIYYKNLYKFILNLSVHFSFKNFDVVIANDSTYTPFFKRKNVRYIRLIHLNFSKYHTRNKFFHTLIVLSSKELSTWEQYHKDIRVIPNFLPDIPAGQTDYKQKKVLSVGRMDRGDQKGFLRLIDIWAFVQESLKSSMPPPHCSWQLIIVGDGEIKGEIESKIKDLGLQDSIILKPFTKDIESEYLSASIYVMASYYEGFPMVLLEASSYALPCIAFDIATGPSDIIEDSKSGYLVQDNDLQGFANKLIGLMNDENKRKVMSECAKQTVKERFNKESIIPLWEEVFKNIKAT